jgi:anionic cell wall polymer biosynthesis LytR-Cps2A-Psr (LCP) family protein
MDGEEALAYARSRKSSDDYNRMGRQRCVLQAVAAQSDPATVIRAFPAIASALKKNLFTDIPLESLPDFIELIPKVKADEIVSVRFVPSRFTGERTPDRFPTPDLEVIRSVVKSVLELSAGEALNTLDLENLEKECG